MTRGDNNALIPGNMLIPQPYTTAHIVRFIIGLMTDARMKLIQPLALARTCCRNCVAGVGRH